MGVKWMHLNFVASLSVATFTPADHRHPEISKYGQICNLWADLYTHLM